MVLLSEWWILAVNKVRKTHRTTEAITGSALIATVLSAQIRHCVSPGSAIWTRTVSGCEAGEAVAAEVAKAGTDFPTANIYYVAQIANKTINLQRLDQNH